MKKTICDRCGAEVNGRNASDFYEHVINHRTYIDLCSECEGRYKSVIDSFNKRYDKEINEFIQSFVKEGTFDEMPI